jgi:predicted RNA-binding Zn ribbon-like protein
MSHTTQSPIPANPSDVACIDLVNSSFTDYLGGGDTSDRITSTAWQEWFLGRYGLMPESRDPPPLEELVALRDDLRRILDKWARHVALSPRDVRLLDSRIRAAPVRQRVTAGGAALELVQEPLRRDWPWIIATLAASAVELMRTRDAKRLKTCGNPGCSWVFYDTTVNRSRRYCTATPCGSLIRVRRFRQPG